LDLRRSQRRIGLLGKTASQFTKGNRRGAPAGLAPGGIPMVNLYIGITDYEWFRFLSMLQSVEEVNFWQPGGRTNFRALQPGELFLFKLHAPRNFIVRGGIFARADILLTSLAWDAFGVANGVPSLQEMRQRIAYYRKQPDDPRQGLFDWMPHPHSALLLVGNRVRGRCY
jgi:hypothetical protein